MMTRLWSSLMARFYIVASAWKLEVNDQITIRLGGKVLLRSLDSWLSKDLPSNLQKLRRKLNCVWTIKLLSLLDILGACSIINMFAQLAGELFGLLIAMLFMQQLMKESSCTYKLIELRTGGKLSRHNVHVQQYGPDTITELSTFHLSSGDQTQDLHSRLIFDHLCGFSRQLHKFIVCLFIKVELFLIGTYKLTRILGYRILHILSCIIIVIFLFI
ncbi:hypothetical protein ACH5RR_040466 [Cinchona calisaya]|uniref:SUF system FeS cluster assembly SufBD core domain-containing protein n=1 Tax=Cinchona calisaya TaxID=153742 RepID=A0ABD2XX03_9GENT